MEISFIYQVANLDPLSDSLSPFDFTIYLNKEVAQKASKIELTPFQIARFQEMGSNLLKKLNFNLCSAPYLFEKNTLLLGHVTINSDGKWVATNEHERNKIMDLTSKDNYITYWAHNFDHSCDAYAGLALFDNWAKHLGVFIPELTIL